MYFALVKVFNTYVPFYILKFCAVGWGKSDTCLLLHKEMFTIALLVRLEFNYQLNIIVYGNFKLFKKGCL